jgi:hypothetical protein
MSALAPPITLLGTQMSDVVTGFTGTVTSVSVSLHSGQRIMLTARAVDGRPGAEEWFDAGRLRLLTAPPPPSGSA